MSSWGNIFVEERGVLIWYCICVRAGHKALEHPSAPIPAARPPPGPRRLLRGAELCGPDGQALYRAFQEIPYSSYAACLPCAIKNKS